MGLSRICETLFCQAKQKACDAVARYSGCAAPARGGRAAPLRVKPRLIETRLGGRPVRGGNRGDPALDARQTKDEPVMVEAQLGRITDGDDRQRSRRIPIAPAPRFAVERVVHRSNEWPKHLSEVCARLKALVRTASLTRRPRWMGRPATLAGSCSMASSATASRAGRSQGARIARGHGCCRPCGTAIALRASLGDPRMVLRVAAPVGVDRDGGSAVPAARAMRADLSYVGSVFVALLEADDSWTSVCGRA